jgi:hypothetical protein
MMRRMLSRLRLRSQGRPFDKLRRVAKRGDAEAQFRLGLMYLLGDGVLPAPRMAVNWLELAAAQGHAKALHNLSLIYLSGAAANGPAAHWLTQAEASQLGRANAALLFPDGLSVAVATTAPSPMPSPRPKAAIRRHRPISACSICAASAASRISPQPTSGAGALPIKPIQAER